MSKGSWTACLAFVAVSFTALSLRGPIPAPSPVLPKIQDELGLTAAQAGLLTTLPVLCFALTPALAVALSRRLGTEKAVLASVLVLAGATILRPVGSAMALLGGTLILGIAMTIGNVLIPSVIKEHFPYSEQFVAGLYTAALGLGGALTAGLTGDISGRIGWRPALAVWAVLPILAAACWSLLMLNGRTQVSQVEVDKRSEIAPYFRSKIAWAIGIFLGAQSFAYFAMVTWLPTFTLDTLIGEYTEPARPLVVFQLLGVPGILVAIVATRLLSSQVPISVAVAVGWCIMLTGLISFPSAWAVYCAVGGLAQGAGLALSITLIVARARDATAAREISAVAQTIGFSLGATGPLVVGATYGMSGGWAVPFVFLFGTVPLMVISGIAAGRDRRVA